MLKVNLNYSFFGRTANFKFKWSISQLFYVILSLSFGGEKIGALTCVGCIYCILNMCLID